MARFYIGYHSSRNSNEYIVPFPTWIWLINFRYKILRKKWHRLGGLIILLRRAKNEQEKKEKKKERRNLNMYPNWPVSLHMQRDISLNNPWVVNHKEAPNKILSHRASKDKETFMKNMRIPLQPYSKSLHKVLTSFVQPKPLNCIRWNCSKILQIFSLKILKTWIWLIEGGYNWWLWLHTLEAYISCLD